MSTFIIEEGHCFALELSLCHSQEEIKNAYKRLALRYHPDKNSEPGALAKFRRIKEAYEYLLAKKEKELPSKLNGQKVTTNGKKGEDTYATNGQVPNVQELFRQRNKSSRVITHRLKLTYEEYFKGTTKKITFTRLVNDAASDAIFKESKTLQIDIAPGSLPGTRLSGVLVPSMQPDYEFEFLLDDETHEHFRRIEYSSSLLFVKSIPYSLWATRDIAVEIPLLEGGSIKKSFPDSSSFVDYKLRGRGLPLGPWSQYRGDIIVNLIVQPPEHSDFMAGTVPAPRDDPPQSSKPARSEPSKAVHKESSKPTLNESSKPVTNGFHKPSEPVTAEPAKPVASEPAKSSAPDEPLKASEPPKATPEEPSETNGPSEPAPAEKPVTNGLAKPTATDDDPFAHILGDFSKHFQFIS